MFCLSTMKSQMVFRVSPHVTHCIPTPKSTSSIGIFLPFEMEKQIFLNSSKDVSCADHVSPSPLRRRPKLHPRWRKVFERHTWKSLVRPDVYRLVSWHHLTAKESEHLT